MEKERYYIVDKKQAMNVVQLITAVSMAVLLAVAAFFVAFIMTGCSSIDDGMAGRQTEAGADRSGSAIAFTVDTEGTVPAVSDGDGTARTRTAPGTMTLDGSGSTVSLRDRGFGVFACHTGVHPYVSTSTTANLMYNQLVGHNGTTGQWEYSPLVYWPNGEDGLEAYVTFFAYAPHSDRAGGCIADMSNAEDVGDPWIVYQLGGGEEADGDGGWKARQVDLLYDFRKDQRRQKDVSKTVSFNFRHALATIGDQVTVVCDASVINALTRAWQGEPLAFTLRRFTLDYVLTRKGRLTLNSSGQPNWEAIESEDPKVHRRITFEPDRRMAYMASASSCSTYEWQSEGGNGVFYIPVEAGSDHQRIELTAECSISAGSPLAEVWRGTVTGQTDISYEAAASRGRNLRVSLRMPEVTCSGGELAAARVGQVVCSHGRVHDAVTGMLPCLGRKVAVVTYTGAGTGVAGYSHGLALALADAGQTAWSGAPSLASAYRYHSGAAAGARPEGMSRWQVPTRAQWNLMVTTVTGDDTGLTAAANDSYKAARFNPVLTAAGGTGVRGGADELYWTGTESSDTNAYYMSFEGGKINSTAKTHSYYVRPVLAF